MDNILKTRIRRSGGSMIMAIPKAAQDALGLVVDQIVSISVESQRLVVEPLEEMTLELMLKGLTPADFALTDDDAAWINGNVGSEVID